MINDLEMQDLNPLTLKKSKEELEANRFLLTIYRITELNWNRPTYTLFRKAYSFFASRYKLKYDDNMLYKKEVVDNAILNRDPALPDSFYDAEEDIPLLNYTHIQSEFNLEKEICSCLIKLKQQSDQIDYAASIKRYADTGYPRFQLLYAFICLNNKDINSAKNYLKKSAEKYDLARFILLRNQLFKSKTWGFDNEDTSNTQIITELDKLRNKNKIYTVLCANLIYQALTFKKPLLQFEELTSGLQNIIKPLLTYYKTNNASQMVMSYSAPCGETYPLHRILHANKEQNASKHQISLKI